MTKKARQASVQAITIEHANDQALIDMVA